MGCNPTGRVPARQPARFSFSRPAALLSKVAAEVDVYQLAHRLLQRSQEMGARIFDRTVMESYEVRSDGVTATTGAGATARPYFYMRTTVDGRALVGGEDENYRNPRRRDAAVGRKAAKLVQRFREMFPAIDLQFAYAWAGTFGETEDGLAYIGAVPELPHCFFTLGFGGNGITYSVIAAEIVRDSIQGKKHPDARLFRFDR